MKTGLVLEGGGMRGVYTVGVLDAFVKYNFMPDYLIGVSAGASNGVSFISGQKGRALRTNTEYINDKRYLSFRNLITEGSLFGMDFLYDELPKTIDPFDYDAFFRSPCDFKVGVTDAATGKAVFFGKDSLKDGSTTLKASASIPLVSKAVKYKGREYFDGGTSSPIPVGEALKDGCERLIVVLTRHRDFVKPAVKCHWLCSLMMRKYPAMAALLKRHHLVYKENQAEVAQLEKEGKAFVIAPKAPLAIDRFEKKKEKLLAAYHIGFADGEEFMKKYGDVFLKK